MQDHSKLTIVVGIDYSDTSVLALKRALGLARGGIVHVVHVIETLMASPVQAPVPLPVTPPLDEGTARLARYVEQQLNDLRAGSEESAPLIVSHLLLGPPAEELVQVASDLQADLIVVGTHGRKGVMRLILGSTAERVVRLATCTVLVERPQVNAAETEPRIEPPCPRCVETRTSTGNTELWCAQHRERHGRRHTYHLTAQNAAFPSAHGGMSSIS